MAGLSRSGEGERTMSERNDRRDKVESGVVLPRAIHLVPLENINGFDVRPGWP